MPLSWVVGGDNEVISDLARLKSRLLAARGVSEEIHTHFFQPEYDEVIHDPTLLFGMEEAVTRILKAIQKNEHIVVYGDYDADGISSTALLITTLRSMGALATPYLPHRIDEGYGLNLNSLKSISAEADLIITVDCGVANVEEIAWLKKNKVDVIVVDHHEIGKELPPARAIIHPRHPKGSYPYGYLAGAGTTWKLCQALCRAQVALGKMDVDAEKWLLDLALLGTVGDVVPLLGENRAIVYFGLTVMRMTRRPGLKKLIESLRLEQHLLSTRDISHMLVPRLNAPGRLDHPQPALDLLLSTDAAQALQFVSVVEQYNKQRQQVSRKVAKEAEMQVVSGAPVIFAFNPEWPPGVVGLAAGQLAKKFSKPAVIIGGNGKHGVGSARSVVGINVLQILEQGRDHVLKLGGHAQAAGFSVHHDKVNDFHAALVQFAKQGVVQEEPEEKVNIDAIIDAELLSWEVAEMMDQFEPFGEANPRPVILVKNVPVSSVRLVGKTGDHLKVDLMLNSPLDVIGFGLGSKGPSLGKTVDIVGSLKVDFYRGKSRLGFELVDIAKSGSVPVKSAIEAAAVA